VGLTSTPEPARRVALALVLAIGAFALVGSSSPATGATARHQVVTASGHRIRHLGEFLSPDRKVWCGGGGFGTDVRFCGTGGGASPNPNPPQSLATLASNGKVTICRVAAASFRHVCLQNWDKAPVLNYGQQTESNNVLCTSATSGITCVIASGPGKGRGFFINATSVRRIGPPGPPPPPVPVLGDADAGQVGFGKPYPSDVATGVIITTNVRHIHWRNWGAKRATGTGTGYWVPPGKPFSDARAAPAVVVAYDLGSCHGQRAYLKLDMWLPSRGGRFNSRYAYPTCL